MGIRQEGRKAVSGIRPRSVDRPQDMATQPRPTLTAQVAHYREIPTLDDYLLIHSGEILIEHFARQPAPGNGRQRRAPLPQLRLHSQNDL